MKNPGPTVIVVIGLAAIIGTFVYFGTKKKSAPIGSSVPVPYDPENLGMTISDAITDGKYFEYRGIFIRTGKPGPLASTYGWEAAGAKNFAAAPIATSGETQYPSEVAALEGAMSWVNAFRGGAPAIA